VGTEWLILRTRIPGSDEELQDLYAAYNDSRGSLDSILSNVMCSTLDDEDRFTKLINDAIAAGTLKSTPTWTKSSTSKPAKLARHKKAQKEAAEAEAYAKELGIHDKLYGDKSSGAKGKGKGKGKVNEDGVDEDALKAMIMAKQKGREDRMDAMLAGLEAKYGPKKGAAGKGKGKKRASAAADEGGDDDEPTSRGGKKNKVEEEPSEAECQHRGPNPKPASCARRN
jgi:DnaJ family protein C protein 9